MADRDFVRGLPLTWMLWWGWRCASSSVVSPLCRVAEAGSAASRRTTAPNCQNHTHYAEIRFIHLSKLCNEEHFRKRLQTD